MKKGLIALAAAAALTFGATTVQAQQQTQLTMSTWRALTNNNGGGWNATSTGGLGSGDLSSFIVYCFDDKRYFSPGRTYQYYACLLYTSPSPRDRTKSRMPSSA